MAAQAETTPEVVFVTNLLLNKRDCVNNNSDHQCPNEATIMATFWRRDLPPNTGMSIQCCTDERCKQVAAHVALSRLQWLKQQR